MDGLPGALRHLQGPLDHYGYAAVAACVFAENFGVPLPGQTMLVLAVVDAGSGAHLNVWLIALIGFAASLAGNAIGYGIGRWVGVHLLGRYGRYVHLGPERLAKVEHYFANHGAGVLVIAKFVEGLRQASGLMAGAVEMPFRHYFPANLVGTALWIAAWCAIGDLAGQHIATIWSWASRISFMLLALVLLALVIWFVGRRRKRRRQGA